MKLFFIYFFFFVSLNLTSQNVKILGHVSDENYAPIYLMPSIFSKLIDSKIEEKIKRGAFEFNIQIEKPAFYKIIYKDKRISFYLEPNKAFRLTIDNTKAEDFVFFYEDLAKENALLNQVDLPSIGTKSQRESFKSIAKQSKNAYDSFLSSELSTQSANFKKIVKDNSMSKSFENLFIHNNIEQAGILYQYYYSKFSNDTSLNHDSSFLRLMGESKFSVNFISSPIYFENKMNEVKAKVDLKISSSLQADSTEELTLYKLYIEEAKKELNPIVKEYLTENLIGEWMSFFGTKSDLSIELEEFMSLINSKKKDAVKKKLNYIKQYDAGQPAPTFNFEDSEGMARSLSEFQGKVVYIDAWASWCGPCIAEIPHGRELFKIYKDSLDVQFLYISIDDKVENWKKSMKDRNLADGIQGIAHPNGFNSDFARKYNILGIPNFILIDKKGKIVSLRAPKPSQKAKIISLIEQTRNQ